MRPSRLALIAAAESFVIAPAILVNSLLSLVPSLRARDRALQLIADFHPWSIAIGILAALVFWGVGGRLWFRILIEEEAEERVTAENGM